jgi:putative intracellular protease/amidase
LATFVLTFVLSLVAAGVASADGDTSAAAPQDVVFDLHPAQFCCPQLGTWDATGAVSDSGTYVRTGFHATGSLPEGFEFTHAGAFQEVFELSGSAGTITVMDETVVMVNRDGSTTLHVRWQIVSGTGAYAQMSGHGDAQFLPVPPMGLFRLTGVVSKVD